MPHARPRLTHRRAASPRAPRRRRRPLPALLCAALACASLTLWSCDRSGDESPKTPDSTATQDGGPDSGPPAGCEVQLAVTPPEVGDDVITTRATATNLTDAPLTLTLRDNCPNGEPSWSGVPGAPGYDYYQTCTMGACNPERPPTRDVELPPGEPVTLALIRLALDGGECNEPLTPGSALSLSFTLPLEGTPPEVCGPTPRAVTVPSP